MIVTTMNAACGTTGTYITDGRERCACGSVANPAGYCAEYGTPITVPINTDGIARFGDDEQPARVDWVVTPVHYHCAACDEAASGAIAHAIVTGSVEASFCDDGNHAARVVRVTR